MFLALTPVALLLLADPSPRQFWIGLPFVLLGDAIRVWSAGYLTKLSHLVTAGPFALCRNPLYIGSFLICLGYCVMCGRVEVWIAGPILFWLFHGGAIVHEEKLLRGIYGEDFDAYCKRVPRFFPWPRLGGDSEITTQRPYGEFSVKQVFANDEPRSAVATCVFAIIFGIISYYPSLAPSALLFAR